MLQHFYNYEYILQDVEELIDNIPASWLRVDNDLPRAGEMESPKHQWLVQDGVVIKEDLSQAWRRGNLTVKLVMGKSHNTEQAYIIS